MSTISELINDGEDRERLNKAQQDANIDYARMLVYKSLPESLWSDFGITKSTERTNINHYDFVDKASYSLEGSAAFPIDGLSINVPFDFEIKISENYLPKEIIFYVSLERFTASGLPRNWSSPLPIKLKTVSDIQQTEMEDIHRDNKNLISEVLLEVNRRLIQA